LYKDKKMGNRSLSDFHFQVEKKMLFDIWI